MELISKEEEKKIIGGASVTSTMLNAIARLVSVIYGLGKSVGSTIRRVANGSSCPI